VKLRSFSHEVPVEKGITVIKFFATWCGPCKLYAPAFERVEARNPEANFYEFDIDTDASIREDYGVASVPTTIILKDGIEAKRLVGAHSTNGVDNFVKGVLES
jgi:thioredoxin